MSKFFTIFYYLLALSALGLGTLLVLMQTDIIPGYDVRIVQSGSMEPAIPTGSVVVIQEREHYQVDDIITFGGDQGRGDNLPTTHRIIDDIVQEGELAFITKGDANDSPDIDPISQENVRGAVLFSIPILGFILDFARQPLGFALLIGIPAAFIVFEEASNIYAALRGRKEDGKESAPKEDDDRKDFDTPDPNHIASNTDSVGETEAKTKDQSHT